MIKNTNLVILKQFINTSKELKERKNFHEALALSCIAIAACANDKYPKVKYDSTKFINFIQSNFSSYCSIGFPGIQASQILVYDEFTLKYITYEELIYKKIRCHLIHEANLPNLVFSEKIIIGNYNENTKLPISIIDMLNAMALNYLQINYT